MKISRNDPCHCGSGRKYKACCKPRDEARARARALIGEEAFDQAEAEWLALARQEKEWAVDIAPAPGRVHEDPEAALSLVMVTAGEWVAHAEVISHRPAGAAERARDMVAAVNAVGRALGVLPERLAVPDHELVEPVAHGLAGRGITVEHDQPDDLYEAMSAVLANMDPTPAGGQMVIALTWRETEASPDELADFHQAAADFYTAAPWSSEVSAGPFLLDVNLEGDELQAASSMDLPTRQQWAASVMGGLGESFGLMLHSQPEDLVNVFGSDDPAALLGESIGYAITVDFDHRRVLTRAMQREIAAAGWPVAGPGAYPRLFGMGLPGRRIRAYEVRLATRALRAVTAFARGGDPLAETGMRVTPWDPEAEEESRLDWFHVPDEATPIRAEGPRADPVCSHLWDTDEQRAERMAAEQARMDRFAAWLREQGVPGEEMEADLANADAWRWFLAGVGAAGAATEFDLRLFLYDLYLRKTDPAPEVVHALPRSMRRIVRWLEEREGIRYPFAAGVLDELDRVAARGRELGEGLEETLRLLSYDIYDYLDVRAMICSSDLPGVPGGWPDLMKMEVAQLREELQRRWLLWYDELVRGGMTDYGELEEALIARQRQWENTPHPRVGGRTPAEVVATQQV
ncbi:MAG TPA: SEC-C domain-containing protein [Longimicrobium sp.]|nr:SEC-C domain-containing protein [Longimicrobium sp.]